MNSAVNSVYPPVKIGLLSKHVTVGFVGSMSSLFEESGVPLLRGQNIEPYRLNLENLKYISPAIHAKWKKSSLLAGDVVIVRVGYPGTAAVIPEGTGPINAASLVIVRPNPCQLNSRYLAYVLNSPWGKSVIAGRIVGSAQQVFNTKTAEDFPIPAPKIEVQNRIASILGAYDDLIEVNRRRVAVLEAMARGLFEEWFVRFRFPGHENHKIIDTPDGPLPERWDWANLEDLCAGRNGIQTGPFGSQLHKEDYTVDGIPIVMPKNMQDLRISEDGIARIPLEIAQSLGRHILQEGDIAYGRRGDIGRRAYVSKREDGWFCGTGCLRLRPDQDLVAPRFLFDALGLPTTDGAIKGRALGATMPNLSAGVMKTIPVLAPPVDLQRRYSQLATPALDMSASLEAANVGLAAARDLLLPRLISGDLSVATAEAELEAA